MKDTAAARRYARALADAAAETQAQDVLLEELRAFAALLRSDRMLRAWLLDVRVKAERRAEIVRGAAARAQGSPLAARGLEAVARHGRFEIFDEIVRLYSRELDLRRGVMRVKIRSARPLTPDGANRMEEALSRQTGRRAVVEAETDETLLGGVAMRIDDTVYDASLKTQIERAAARLAA